MRVKMKTIYAGASGTCQPDHIIDLPEAEAKGLVDGGYAVAVDQAPEDGEQAPEDGEQAPEETDLENR